MSALVGTEPTAFARLTKKFKWILYVGTVISILMIVVLIDTAPYRKAVKHVVNMVPTGAAESVKTNIQADMNLYLACSAMRNAKTSEFTSKGRDCLLEAMPKTKTAFGAMLFGVEAYDWLIAHPSDVAIRNNAMQAIANGRLDLAATKPWRFDGLERVAEACDKSVILRWTYCPSTYEKFGNIADQLDKTEFAILLPDVATRQRQWRAHVILDTERVAGAEEAKSKGRNKP